MKTSKKKPLKAVGGLLVLLLAGIIFFFTYYQVDVVQVMGSNHYSVNQIRKMGLIKTRYFLQIIPIRM